LIRRVNVEPKLFGYLAITIVSQPALTGWLLLSIALADLPQRRRRQ